jgi:molybdopterin molybdotransferase
MLSVAEAWERVVATLPPPLEAERVRLEDAGGRVVAQDTPSAVDLPPFDRSAMDGYAVRAADTAPGVPLRLAGEVAAGEVASGPLEPGTAAAITTGAAVPPEADAILRSEHAEEADGSVVPTEAVPPGLHIRYRGEDVREGDVLAVAGERLTLPRMSALASAGVGEVAVHRRPRLHMVATGSELLPIGAPPEPGRIHESNRLTIRLMAERAGAIVHDHGVVADELEATREAVAAGLDGDVLVVSGGVSVGPHDHVKPAFDACGVEEIFWRVRLKPGKPLFFGRHGATLVYGLPGNPLSTIVGFMLFIEPALRRLTGEANALPRFERARLLTAARADDGRTTLLTARLLRREDGTLEALPTERQGSHMTGALGESDGFVLVPVDDGALSAGAEVDALLLD